MLVISDMKMIGGASSYSAILLLISAFALTKADVDTFCVALHCGLQSAACAIDSDCSKVNPSKNAADSAFHILGH